MTGRIYGLYCDCHEELGTRYVGLTSRPVRVRLNEHLYSVRKGGTLPVHNWMRTHSWRYRVLEDHVPLEELSEREGYWIDEERPDKNLDPYGGMGNRAPRSPETREKQSKALSGRKKPEGFGEKISEAHRKRREMAPNKVIPEKDYATRDARILSILALKGVVPSAEAARIFDIHRNSVWHIWSGRTWPEVTGISHV